jgi:transcriptional regulator with XRE-family HTH domain
VLHYRYGMNFQSDEGELMTEDAGTIRASHAISEKIDHLFRTVRRGDGREFTYEDVERGTNGCVSRSYVWKLRHGHNRNPSMDVIEALGRFFSVPPEYFFSSSVEDNRRGREAAEAAALLRDPTARAVAESARGLGPVALKTVIMLIDGLHALEEGRFTASIPEGRRVDQEAA